MPPTPTQPLSSPPATKRELAAWMLYDFANTAFTVMIVTFVYGVYFKKIVCQGQPWGDFLWGLNATISLGAVALAAPVLGALADHARGKKFFLILFTLVCVGFSSLLARVEAGMVARGMVLFILANIGFQGGVVFYNAFLPELAPPEKVNTLSGLGWGVGYLGAILVILLARPLLTGGFAPENLANLRLSFVLQAGFFLVFALPVFFWLKDRGWGQERLRPDRALVRAAFTRLGRTFRSVRRYRELFKFLVAYFVYIEGLTTVIYFATIYASDSLGFTLSELVVFYVLVQSAGIAGAVFFGLLGDRFWPRKTVAATLILWLAVVGAAYLTTSKALFWWIGLGAGLAMGATQCLSRAMMAMMTPRAKVAEFFGFYGVFGKFSAAIGPFVFGAVSALTQSQRTAMLSVGLFFLLGLILLLSVNEAKGFAVKEAEDRAAAPPQAQP